MSGDDEDEGEAHPHESQPLLYQLSNTATVVESTVECKCFQIETALVFHFPMERFITRRAGPPVTAMARAACRGRLPCSREAQSGDQARDGAVVTSPEEETRR